MNQQPPTPSGSRWEPTGTPGPVPPPAPPAAEPTEPAVATEPAPQAAPRRTSPVRGRLLLAGGALGVLLAGGVGGFAVGHATAGDGDEAGRGGQVAGTDDDTDLDGFGYGDPGRGGFPPPGGEGFAPPDGDRPDGDGFGGDGFGGDRPDLDGDSSGSPT